ncbi:MAG: GGDEF domain-containing protein [Magnetococcus sp. XQGC-1]
MSETRKRLAQIRELLAQDPPETRQSLRLVKDLLIQGTCSWEQDGLRQASALLLERLVLPALSGTQERQARVGRLVRQIRTARPFTPHTLAGALEEIAPWLAVLPGRMEPVEADPPFPASLLREALVTWGGKAVQELFPANKEPDWQEISLPLGHLINQERRQREEWQREMGVLQSLLADAMQTLLNSMRLIDADTGELPFLLDRLRQEEAIADWLPFQEGFLQALQRFRERTIAVRHRLREVQEAVERSRLLVRHADWALMETRDEKLVDAFTGLPNRFGLLARLEQAKQMEGKEGFVLIAILLEEYAEIVRDLGRERVNRLLGAIAGRMVSLMRPGDYLARFNDETFLLIGFKMAEQEAMELAGQWREVLDRTRFELSDAQLLVRTSYGVASYEQGENTESLLGLAVMAAQEALAEGSERLRVVPTRQKPLPPPPPKRLFGFR